MLRRTCLLLLVAILAFFAPQAIRADDVLESVPGDAFLVFRFSSVDRFVGNTNDMLAAIGPLAASAGPQVEAIIGEMTDLQERVDAIDRTAPVVIAVFPFFDQPQPVAVFVQTADEAKLRRAVLHVDGDDELTETTRDDGFVEVASDDRTMYFAQRGPCVVYTGDEEVVKLLANENTKMKSFATVLPARALDVFGTGDAAMAANIAPVVKRYRDAIEQAHEEIVKVVQALPNEQLGGPSAESIKTLYQDLLKIAFDAVYDARWAVGQINLNADGAAANVLFGFKKDSATDKLLAANPTLPLKTLGSLPAGGAMYFGVAIDYGQWAGDWLKATYGDNVKNKEQLEEALKLMSEVHVQSTVAGYQLPLDGKTRLSATTIQEVSDATKVQQMTRTYMQAVGEIKTPGITQTFDLKENAEQYQGHSIDLTTVKMTLGDSEPAKMLKGLYDKMFGGDEFQTRSTTHKGLVVQAVGNDPELIHGVLDSLESGAGVVGAEESYGTTRGKLAKKANVVLLIDYPRLIVSVFKMMRDVQPFADAFRMLPFNFDVAPPVSYSGLSIGSEPQGLRVKLFVPVEQPRGMMLIFGPSL